jgi:hypothetical protein
MTTISTPITNEVAWSSTARHISHPRSSMMVQTSLNDLSVYLHELLKNLNELCYRGFDELNTLIQEQRWVRIDLLSSVYLT